MKASLLEVSVRRASSTRKVLLSILSGILLTASFPPGKLSFLAWLALVPLLWSIDNESPSSAFKLGLIAGFSHYVTLIYWIVVVLGRYGNLNAFVSLGCLFLLCLYLALYIALFSTLTTFLAGSRATLIFTASFWVALEYMRANFLLDFPWCLLGYSQYRHLSLIQISDLCGVYGLSFVIVLINGLIYHLLFKHAGKTSGSLKWDVLIAGLAIGGTLGYGYCSLSKGVAPKESFQSVNTVIIQANIDQSIKWDPSYQAETMATYLRLTRASYDFKPDLIVWSETSLPFFFQDNLAFSPKVLSLPEESKALLIFGSPAYKQTAGRIKYYNRVYLISPDRQPVQYYDKVHLVPFGEYVPLKKLLFFVNRLVPAAGDFEAGDKIAPLKHEDLSAGILICFESIFPELARSHTKGGANILVNLTNDAWFGMTGAPYQHLSMTVFRAVENRRPIIRAANTGFSAFIEPQGKIIALSSLFSEKVLKGHVNISVTPMTFYTRFGDVFALSLIAICLIKVFCCIRIRRNGRGISVARK